MFFRNVVINVSMPFDIEEYRSLQTMDLVFNNLIVKFQVLCSALILLFLGNNGLSGTIPQQKAVYLKNMNLVASNFMFDGSNICILPGLNCLQRNFPCSKNAPCYSSFAI
ncbi:probable LRR receptor-like serine/threonine-protein kinase At1g56130 isoform X4 [Mangifera indica]|uniref:probable LRR receptor-like serine/threonine-protein kinase At1g56130 isoform X4 n=1 Tax=Mangifera indica TaxID=29780 RepID=UPI001CF95CDE|nr:probable LRR receptor-like serine/threonine-protein kinase At1g56130 isoform X4 [Mangifera indica]